MNTKLRILGVITARGGSKGIPGKNIRPMLGKPLIAYTIEAAIESGALDKIILSTDSEEIAQVARQYGCEVPFMRPAELAEDKTPHLPVTQHAVQWMQENENYTPDYVMILQPTAPLREAADITAAVELLLQKNVDSVVSVCAVSEHYNPHWQMNVDEQGNMSIFTGEDFAHIVTRRQELPKTYMRNGSVYVFKTGLLFDTKNPSFYGNTVAAHIMDERKSINIDTLADWEIVERELKKRYEQTN